MGNENNKEKGSAFFFVAIICGLIVAFYVVSAIFKKVTYEFEHHTEDTILFVFFIGVVSIILYKVANTEGNTESANQRFCEEVTDFCVNIYKPFFTNSTIKTASLEEQKAAVFSKITILNMIRLRIEYSSKTDTENLLRFNEDILQTIYAMSKDDLALAIYLICLYEKKSIRIDIKEQSQFLANVIHNRIKKEIPNILISSKQQLSADIQLYNDASKDFFKLAESLNKLNLK